MVGKKIKVPMVVNRVTRQDGPFYSVVLEFGLSVLSYNLKKGSFEENKLQNHPMCCSPNHPIQTKGGFIPAEDFKVGDIMMVDLPLVMS
jgi:hypothetical protein